MNERLIKDIRNRTFARVYVFHGEEHFLKVSCRTQLTKVLIPEGAEMNLTVFQGNAIDIKEVIAAADTMPFFSEYRLIVLQDTGLFSAKGNELAAYLPNIPETTVLAFFEEKIDKRSQNCKLFRSAVSVGGVILEQSKQTPQQLQEWCARRLARDKKRITRNAAALLVSNANADMQLLVGEMEKLTAFTEGRDAITLEDVERVTTVTAESRFFHLQDQLSKGLTDAALHSYRDLLGQKLSSVWLLQKVGERYTQLYEVKQLRQQGFNSAIISERTGIRDFIVRQYLQYADAYSLRALRRCMQICAQADEAVKTGRMEADTAVETALVQISMQRS